MDNYYVSGHPWPKVGPTPIGTDAGYTTCDSPNSTVEWDPRTEGRIPSTWSVLELKALPRIHAIQ